MINTFYSRYGEKTLEMKLGLEISFRVQPYLLMTKISDYLNYLGCTPRSAGGHEIPEY